MRPVIFILCMTVFSYVGYNQTDIVARKDSSYVILKSFNLRSLNETKYNSVKFPDYTFGFKNTSSRFTLFHDSLFVNRMLYDNYRHEYFYNDPLQPYGNFQSAIVGGTLNYLFLLINKKR